MKKHVLSVLLAACFTLLALTACGGKAPEATEPSLCEALFSEIRELRQDVSLAEAFTLCSQAAVGTVTGVKTLDNDYLPICVSDSGLQQLVPLEQWSVTHTVVTVRIDRVLSGEKFQAETTVTFNIPGLFRELSQWDPEEPVYTGRSFTLTRPDAALPQTDESVVLLWDGSRGSDRVGGTGLSFAFCGDRRVDIDWLFLSDYSGEYAGEYAGETGSPFRRNAIPPRDPGETVLDAAFLAPMKARQLLSSEKAGEESDFVIRGTVSAAYYVSEQACDVFLYGREGDGYLECWQAEGWYVTVTVDEIIKEEGEALTQETEISVFIPTALRRTDSDLLLPVSSLLPTAESAALLNGVVPQVGGAVEAYWNGGFNGGPADMLIRCGEGACEVLYPQVYRHPERHL